MSDERLTGKQAKFVTEYIICLNGTEAARRAGYSGDENALAAAASRLLRNVKITHAIDDRLKEFAMPANEVLVQLTDIARGDISDSINNFGGIDPTQAARRGKAHLIKRFKIKSITTEEQEIVETEIEMYDRLSALQTLAKYHNLVNTNTVKLEDWRSQAIEDIKAGKLSFEALQSLFDESLAADLFKLAGVPVGNDPT